MSTNNKNKNGYITLFSILIAGAIGLASTVSMLILGLNSTKISSAIEQSNQSKAIVNGCMEQALQYIKDNPDFTGSGTVPFPNGDCLYTITGASPNKTIQITGVVGTITRKGEITIDQINPINIASWQEVDDF